MLFLRVTPSLPNLFINLASPIVDIPFHIFFLATVVGLVPASYITVRVSLFLFDLQIVMNKELPFLNLVMLDLVFATVFASTRPGLLLVNWNRWKIYTISRPWPCFSSSGPFYYSRQFWRGSVCTSRALVYNYSKPTHTDGFLPWSEVQNRRKVRLYWHCLQYIIDAAVRGSRHLTNPRLGLFRSSCCRKSWICTDILEECWICALLQKSNLKKLDMNRPWFKY